MPLMADDHTISADAPPAISLEAAVALTGRSRRTWWRRIEEGAVAKLAPDARGRALLVFDEVRPAIGLSLDDEDVAAILRADGGDAQAQAQVGALFALAALKEDASSSPLPASENALKSRGALCRRHVLVATGSSTKKCRCHALAGHSACGWPWRRQP